MGVAPHNGRCQVKVGVLTKPDMVADFTGTLLTEGERVEAGSAAPHTIYRCVPEEDILNS